MADIRTRLALLSQEVDAVDEKLAELEAKIESIAPEAERDPGRVKAEYEAARAEMEQLRRKSVEYRQILDDLRTQYAALVGPPVKLDGLPPAIAKYLEKKLDKKS